MYCEATGIVRNKDQIWRALDLSREVKVKTYQSLVQAVFGYNSGTWSLRENHKWQISLCNGSALKNLQYNKAWFSLNFHGHFPGEPGFAGVYWHKRWWRWWWQLDCWSYKSCRALVKSSPPTNQHPVFYRPDALPVTQPTVSKHWRENNKAWLEIEYLYNEWTGHQ